MKIAKSDFKFLFAYIVPLAAIVGIIVKGYWVFFLPLLAFGILPVLELIIKPNDKNFTEEEEQKRLDIKYFDYLLYLIVPLQVFIIFLFAYHVAYTEYSTWELLGMIWTTGISCGVLGINVAHELGHRNKPFEKIMAKILLLTSLYMHFIVEHNRGHHRNVSTPLDPASARYNEPIYLFYFRTIINSFKSAWELEKLRLHRAEKSAWSIENEIIRFQIFQIALVVFIFLVFGLKAMLSFIAAAFIGILLLETVNYIEHYGLSRREVAPGVYERVKPTHSWNSDHVLGRILLFELTRHSDHHYKANRPYQNLRHFNESPQLPTGYPGMMTLALIPPLWFRIMNPKADKINDFNHKDAVKKAA